MSAEHISRCEINGPCGVSVESSPQVHSTLACSAFLPIIYYLLNMFSVCVRAISGVLLSCFPAYFLRQSLSLSPELTDSVPWPGQTTPERLRPRSLMLGLQVFIAVLGIYDVRPGVWTQVFMLSQEALHRLRHLSTPHML